MAVIQGGSSGALTGVAEEDASAMHITTKPIPYAGIGHYRTTARFVIANSQAANSRLFSVRNIGSNLIIPTRLTLRWLQTGAHTAAIEDSLDIFYCSSFTVTDTTNTTTPTVSRKRSTMSAGPSNAEIRQVTAAGAAAGMTGGTLTKIGSPFAQLPKWLLLAMPTAGSVEPSFLDTFDDVNGTHPFAIRQNEGIEIENRVLLGAAAASVVYVDFCYVETTFF